MYSWLDSVKILIPEPIKFFALPEGFSLEAKNDRSQKTIPVRVSYICNKDPINLTDNWPDNRIPTGFSAEKPDFRRVPMNDPNLFWDSENSSSSE